MRVAEACVVEIVEDERTREIERAFERELRYSPSRRSEPALPHSSIVSPGSGEITSTPGASSRSSAGVPARIGKVP